MFDPEYIEFIEYYLWLCEEYGITIDFDDFEVFKEAWWLDDWFDDVL